MALFTSCPRCTLLVICKQLQRERESSPAESRPLRKEDYTMRLRSLGLFLTAVVFIPFCVLAASAVRPGNKVRDGGTLVRRLENDINTLNYILQTTQYERWVLSCLYDPLIDLDANLQPVPATAARWAVSPV